MIIDADGNDLGYASTYGTGVEVEKGEFPVLSVFDFNSSQTLAGNIVQGTKDLIEAGHLSLYPLQRSGGTVQLASATVKPGAATSVHVSEANLTALGQARNDLATTAFAPDQQGATSCQYESVTSSADASYKAGLSFGYMQSVKIKDTFSYADDNSSNHVLVVCQDSFFTLSFLPDAGPDGIVGLGSFFPANLPIDSAKQFITSHNPPLYVSQVTYGAQLYMLVSSTISTTSMENALTASFAYAGSSISVDEYNQSKSALNTMSVRLLSIGGRASAQTMTDTAFSGASVADGLVKWLQDTQDFAPSKDGYPETALPLSYQLNYLDHVPVAFTASINGDPTVGPNGQFQQAVIYFHSDGDGKNANTTLDVAIFDHSGTQIGTTHVIGADFANNQDTNPIVITPVASGFTRSALDDGSFDLLIHPVGDDTWNFTAYIALCYIDPNSGQNTSTPNCPGSKGSVTEVDYRYSDRVSNHRHTNNKPEGGPSTSGTHTVESTVQLSQIQKP